MADESNVNVESSDQATPAEMRDVVSTRAEEGSAPTPVFESLFGAKRPTEEQLRGEAKEPEKSEESKPAEKYSETSAPEAEEKKDEGSEPKKDEEKDSDKEEKQSDASKDKPPTGFVPLEALREERGKRQQLTEEVLALKQAMLELQAKSLTPPKQEAKTDAERKQISIPDSIKEDAEEFIKLYPEHRELLLEDSRDGERIRKRLESSGADHAADVAENIMFRRSINQRETDQLRALEKQQHEYAVESGFNRIKTAVPGLMEQESQVAKELSDYAATHGFKQDGEALYLLTNPATMVVVNGKQRPLGEAAAELVEFMYRSMSHSRDAVKAAVEKTKAEFASKIKEQKQQFRSVADAPSGGSTKSNSYGGKTYAQMSPAEREAYLREMNK